LRVEAGGALSTAADGTALWEVERCSPMQQHALVGAAPIMLDSWAVFGPNMHQYL